jgi:urea-proton symporter
MFSILACKTKMNAPRCHTFLEIILYRYGKLAHVVFLFFSLVTNILVGSQLLLGGSAVLSALTSMNVYSAIFLIPLGVVLYVITGGLRATFLCDYSHTIVVMIIILYFMFKIYAEVDLIGSPSRMYDLLEQAAEKRPVAGNKDGSYLTLKSNGALIFGVIQLCSGSGTVFLDQAYWQRAIASKPSTAVRAYILGGLAWFAIPFGFATTLGLAAVALTDSPSFPTYPEVPTRAQISSGLASAFSASAVLGSGGAAALLVTLFMAVTSCASAELIAVSSVLTFDVYKTYIKPDATPKQLIFVSHVNVAIFGLTMSVWAVIWQVIGIDLGWLFLFMGLAIGGAVFPVAFSITWKKQTRIAAISGALCGLAAGLTAWLVTAQTYYGALTLETTNAEYSTLAGNLAAISVGGIVSTVVTLVNPDDFDWEITRAINAEHAHLDGEAVHRLPPQSEPMAVADGLESGKTPGSDPSTPPEKVNEADPDFQQAPVSLAQTVSKDSVLEESPRQLRAALKVAIIASIVIPFIMDFLVPIPMFLSHYIFSKAFFTAWVVIR